MKKLIENILAKKYTDAQTILDESLTDIAVRKIEEQKDHVAEQFFEGSEETLDDELPELTEEQLDALYEGTLVLEDVEDLQELSKEKLGRYIGKASHDASMSSFRQGTLIDKKRAKAERAQLGNKTIKRENGIHKAVKKLTGKAKVNAT